MSSNHLQPGHDQGERARQTRTPLRSRVETPIPIPQIPPQPSSASRQPLPQFPQPIQDQRVIDAQEAWLVAHAQRYQHPPHVQAQAQAQAQIQQQAQLQPQQQPQPGPRIPAVPPIQSQDDQPIYHTLDERNYDTGHLKIAGSQSWYDHQREEENERQKRKFEETQREAQQRARKRLRDKAKNAENGDQQSAEGEDDGEDVPLAVPTLCQEITPLQFPKIRPTLMLGPYPSREAATEAVMEYAIAQGYMLVVSGSQRDKPGKGQFDSDMPVIRVDLACDRGGVCKSHSTGLRKRTTHRLGCPARMKIVSRKRDCRQWFIEAICEQHNHNLSLGDMEGFATYRRWRRMQAGRTGPETPEERSARRKKMTAANKKEPSIPPPVFHSLATPMPALPPPVEPAGPLHTAALKGQRKIMEILLNKGADVNGVDPSGRTPLHCAVESGKMDAITMLLNRGADVTKLTRTGVSVLQLAVEKELEDAVVMFIERGADPNV